MRDAADPIGALMEAPAPPRAGDDWQTFVDTIAQLRTGAAGWPAELEQAWTWYEPYLERMHEDAATRKADLIQLEQIAAGYPSRERFLTELTLDPPDATSDSSRGKSPSPQRLQVVRVADVLGSGCTART